MAAAPLRIVVLDGHPMNPGDLSWSELEALGALELHPRTSPAQLQERAAGAPVLLTNKVVLGAEQLRALPDLRYVGVTATGVNVVDLAAARELGVTVTNVPGYSTASVAQLVFAFILEHYAQLGAQLAATAAGAWPRSPDFSFTAAPLRELEGRTLGVVGLGAIGRRVAAIAEAFGMQVLVHSRSAQADARWRSLDALLGQADIVSLHCPLTEQTRGLMNAERLARMKPSALLVNTARGPLIDEAALAAALRAGRLGGAALDVLSVEPPPADHPLLGAPRCLITPHLAWATVEARQRLLSTVTHNLRAYLEGVPVNVV